MDPWWKKWFVSEGLHDDLFGEVFNGRQPMVDPQNQDLLLKMMKNYVKVYQE